MNIYQWCRVVPTITFLHPSPGYSHSPTGVYTALHDAQSRAVTCAQVSHSPRASDAPPGHSVPPSPRLHNTHTHTCIVYVAHSTIWNIRIVIMQVRTFHLCGVQLASQSGYFSTQWPNVLYDAARHVTVIYTHVTRRGWAWHGLVKSLLQHSVTCHTRQLHVLQHSVTCHTRVNYCNECVYCV